MNKDFKDSDKSITSKQTKKFQMTLMKRLRKDPLKVHLGIFFLAGHGMICDGTQQFLLNEFCRTREFYKLYPIEKIARVLTESMRQCYLIVIVACCRENFNFKRHSNCVGADSKMQACLQFWLRKQTKHYMDGGHLTIEELTAMLDEKTRQFDKKMSKADKKNAAPEDTENKEGTEVETRGDGASLVEPVEI